ncbi:hypothetical protein RIR_jg25299.t1 [Rhizophagus irregularis DAOM 181602=DAOM 197198]|uniref:Uncharacterized protein n=1 Tax=Rhizophagus irregularis (strain DAOM 181602 / DAOM 197198 / MUCL 43194) TaxID=747089 RepID=U9T2G1_RHIID|nr:hypothetical protein RIR_jg25299.t1 [Rhizophagus irregularis DAOM 181602=DAOM 197198]
MQKKKYIIKISYFNRTSVQSRNGKNIIDLWLFKLMVPAIILFPLNNNINNNIYNIVCIWKYKFFKKRKYFSYK